MFGIFKKKGHVHAGHAVRLAAVVAMEMPEADAETVRIVASITGLLGHIAFSDHDYAPSEAAVVRRELERVNGLSKTGVDAILKAFGEHMHDVAACDSTRCARDLKELCTREFRVEILGLLLEVAAADGTITTLETNALRQAAMALGLTQDDYVAAQSKHKDKLAVLGG